MELLPVFGLISDIIVFDVDNFLLVCEKLVTECFRHHFHSYEVNKSRSYVILQTLCLFDHSVLGLYQQSGHDFVT